MFLEAESRRPRSCRGNGQQPGFAVAMPAPIDGNGFQAEIDGGQMRAGGDAGLAQDRGGQQPAEPGRMLNTCSTFQASRAMMACSTGGRSCGLPQHAAPFIQPLVLVPVEIVDQRILFRARRAGQFCLRSMAARSGRAPRRWRRARPRTGPCRIRSRALPFPGCIVMRGQRPTGTASLTLSLPPSPTRGADAARRLRRPSGLSAQPGAARRCAGGCAARRGRW
jgi:hypothetical protein